MMQSYWTLRICRVSFPKCSLQHSDSGSPRSQVTWTKDFMMSCNAFVATTIWMRSWKLMSMLPSQPNWILAKLRYTSHIVPPAWSHETDKSIKMVCTSSTKKKKFYHILPKQGRMQSGRNLDVSFKNSKFIHSQFSINKNIFHEESLETSRNTKANEESWFFVVVAYCFVILNLRIRTEAGPFAFCNTNSLISWL